MEDLSEFRIELAKQRGFIPESATAGQIATGLEAMHEAPLKAVGKYLLPETVTIIVPDTRPNIQSNSYRG